MNGLDKLEIGKAYTYKELCAILGEKETNNREKQRKKWNRFFEFKYEERSYYILSIREVPLPDGRSSGNNSKYIYAFTDLIMRNLEEFGETEYRRQQDWIQALGIVTPLLYADYKTVEKEYSSLIANHSDYYAKTCQLEVQDFISSKFLSALNRLERNGFLQVIDSYIIHKQRTEPIVATAVEAAKIEAIQNSVMADMGIKSFKDAKFKNKYISLINCINEKLQDTYQYEKVYRVLGLKKKSPHLYEYTYDTREEAKKQLLLLIRQGLEKHFTGQGERGRERVERQTDTIFEQFLMGEDYSDSKISFRYEIDYEDKMINLMDIFLSL